MHTPVRKRSTIHGIGDTHTPWMTTAAEAMRRERREHADVADAADEAGAHADPAT